jgi:hypothetical protein
LNSFAACQSHTQPTNQPTNQKKKKKEKNSHKSVYKNIVLTQMSKIQYEKGFNGGYRLELLQTGTTEQPGLLNLAHLTLPEHLKLLLVLLLEMLVPQLLLLS